MKILKLNRIKEVLSQLTGQQLIECIEEAFVALSDGSADVPPVGHLGFQNPPGDMHIKYGYISGESYYVVKIASGFYENSAMGLPNNNGMMIVFNAKTGQPECLLQDEGYLTDLRTALAGAVAAKYLAPKEVKNIGVIGTGVQARMQLDCLRDVTDCRTVYAYGRSPAKLKLYQKEMADIGFDVQTCKNPSEVAGQCNLIVTTTASQRFILSAKDIQPGTHITAMGSDAPGKQELEPSILQHATLFCDSKSQCIDHGEVYHAINKGLIKEDQIRELGNIINHDFERPEMAITVADLTGIATQDIKIASLVVSLQEN